MKKIKAKPKPILRIYFDTETYTLRSDEPVDFPEIREIGTGEFDPETGKEYTIPRKVVNTFVYAIG